jgi:hypothetical protein
LKLRLCKLLAFLFGYLNTVETYQHHLIPCSEPVSTRAQKSHDDASVQ